MATRIDCKSPACAREVLVAQEVRFHRFRMGERRVQIDRHAERLSALEDHPVLLLVEEAPLSVAVDHRALEAELLYRALELFRRRFGVGGGQRGERGEAIRVRLDRGVRAVVGVARHGDRDLRAKRLRPRRAER